jgi:hypothetical protein
MDVSALMNFGNVLIFGICLCVGFILKDAVQTDKINRYIPLIMGALGVALSFWIFQVMTPTVLLTGLFSGLASTGAYEAFKNLIKNISKEK